MLQLTVFFLDSLLISPPSFQLLQDLGLNLPTGAGTDQHMGSAIALYLVLHGADVNFYNHEGKTPLDLCPDPQTANRIQQCARNVPRYKSHVVTGCIKIDFEPFGILNMLINIVWYLKGIHPNRFNSFIPSFIL